MLVAFVPQFGTQPVWISALLVLCVALRWWSECNRGFLVNAWIRTPLALVCFFAVFQSYQTVNGVEAGSALLSVMAALKVLETRKQRDLFVLLFIALFLVLAGFLVDQYLWSAPYLVIASASVTTAWLAAARRGSARSRSWYLKHMRRHLLLASPILLAMWILFPRVPGPFWAIPTSSNESVTGLSDKISPGDISRLSKSEAVAFRVYFNGATPARDKLYWRAITMSKFDGRSWAADKPARRTSPAESVIPQVKRPTRYTVTMEPTNQHWLFALDMPTRWQGRDIYRTREQTLERERPVEKRLPYQVASHLEYVADLQLSSYARRRNIDLPAQGNVRARALGQTLRQQYDDDLALVNAMLTRFSTEPFYYTLEPPALGRDAIDEFLFDTRRGFCEHYASSFAFVMRAAGIPTRVVTGYQGGERNPLADHLTVRQSDAHAWTEVWLPERGWSRVDPTAAVAPGRIEQNLEGALLQSGERSLSTFDFQFVERARLAWDMINARWNEWVLGYGPETQRRFMESLGLSDPNWRDLTIMLAIVLIGIMGTVTVYLWLIHQPARPDGLQRLFLRAQARLGVPAYRGETPTTWASRVSEIQPEDGLAARRFARDFLQARYADNSSAAARLSTSLRRMRRRPLERLGLRRRRAGGNLDAR